MRRDDPARCEPGEVAVCQEIKRLLVAIELHDGKAKYADRVTIVSVELIEWTTFNLGLVVTSLLIDHKGWIVEWISEVGVHISINEGLADRRGQLEIEATCLILDQL